MLIKDDDVRQRKLNILNEIRNLRSLSDQFDAINAFCKGTIGITSYGASWEIHSYASGTFLSMYNIYPYFKAKNLESLIYGVLDLMQKKIESIDLADFLPVEVYLAHLKGDKISKGGELE